MKLILFIILLILLFSLAFSRPRPYHRYGWFGPRFFRPHRHHYGPMGGPRPMGRFGHRPMGGHGGPGGHRGPRF